MLGEVGIDRSFRVPFQPFESVYPDSPGTRRLSPFTVPLDHQLAIVEAQLAIAVELKRNASMHSVKAQQATVDLLQRMSDRYGQAWDDISVDLHSCGLSAESWKQVEVSKVAMRSPVLS